MFIKVDTMILIIYLDILRTRIYQVRNYLQATSLIYSKKILRAQNIVIKIVINTFRFAI
jgi:hypothetical protein